MNKIEVLINPVAIKVLTLDSGLIQLLDSKFKFKDNSLRYSTKIRELVRKGLMDEYKHFFSKKTCKLPIGFLKPLLEELEKQGYEVTIEDLREYPETTALDNYDNIFPGVEFRYYQKEALDIILKDKKHNGIVEGATAFGKTLVFLTLCKLIKQRILIIFPGKQLVFQTYDEARKLGITDIGLVSGDSLIIGKRIMLVNYQSLEKMEGHENVKEFKTVIVDEMHTAKAATLYNFLKKIPASIRLGFSATPFKPGEKDALDNAFNRANLGDLIYVKKAAELMKEGFIATVDIKFVKIENPANDYFCNHIQAVDKLIVNNSYRNNIIKSICEMNDKKTLIIVQMREHGEILHKLIENSIMYVHGDTGTELREEVRKQLDSGEVKRVVTTVVWSTGINIPNLERIVIAGSGKSFYQTIQRIGRGLRKTDDKTHLEVWDFADVTNKYLEEWSKDRWKYYKKESFPVEVVDLGKILAENKDNK
jgi:superfamily II DNA or RNA helicase